MAMTPRSELRKGIIAALNELGGSATRPDVLARLEENMRTRFTPEDYEAVKTRPFEQKWANRASYERADMVAEGLLTDRNDGVWELSVPPEFARPTADRAELDRRVSRLLRLPSLPRPVGEQAPARRTSAQQADYDRLPSVKAWVLLEAKGRCELCQIAAPFVRDDGTPYLEVHHVKQLADHGADVVENAVALCPSCHRRLHYGADRSDLRERLYNQVPRLVRSEVTEGPAT
jgi:5-methylcytosine-specific restriction endonuclease McrA